MHIFANRFLDAARSATGTRARTIVTIAYLLGIIAVAGFIAFDGKTSDVTLTAHGSFTRNGEYPSSYSGLVHVARFGSWSGSDTNTGTLVSQQFVAPAALVMSIVGYPSHPTQRIVLRNLTTGATQRLGFGPDLGTTWRPVYVPISPAWQGKLVQLVAVDAGTMWGDWLGLAGLRPARLDERIFATPILSRWAVIGLIYFISICAGLYLALRPFGRPRLDRVWATACVAVTLLAFVTGWTNIDLSGWFATWGRDALQFGPASLYQAPWPSDNPPLNPTMMVLPAALEALFRTTDPHLDPFFFKLVPIGSLFVLPLVMRAALLSVGVNVEERKFRTIVLWTVANPVFIWATAIWGQSDIFVVVLVIAAFIGFTSGRPGMGAAFFAAGVLTKPQPVLALPIIAVQAVHSRRPLHVVAAIVLVVLSVLPTTYPHGALSAVTGGCSRPSWAPSTGIHTRRSVLERCRRF